MPEDLDVTQGVIDTMQDDISYDSPEQSATTPEEMSDYQEATVSEETSTNDAKPSEEVTEDPPEEGAEEKAEDAAKEEPKEDKPKGDVPVGVQKRINKITKKKYESDRRAEQFKSENDELRRENAELKAGKGLAEIEGKKPNRDDFEEDTDFYSSMAEWSAKKVDAEKEVKNIPEVQPAQNATPEKATQEEIDMVRGMGRQAYGDFDTVINTAKYMPDVAIKEACKTDSPHEILYEIAQSDTLQESLFGMNQFGVAKEIARIAGTLADSQETQTTEAKPTKTISNAPTPIKPSTGTHSVKEKTLAELSNAEYRKKRGFSR